MLSKGLKTNEKVNGLIFLKRRPVRKVKIKKAWLLSASVTRKKLPNVYKSCPKMI